VNGVPDLIFPGRITLIFPGEPKPKQSTRFSTTPYIDKKGNKRFAYQDPEVKARENTIAWTAVQQLPKGFIPWDCGVMVVRALYVFPIPSSMSKIEKMRIQAGELLYKTSKPDLSDNISKGFFDALQNILFTNDSRVCHIKEAMKIYGTNPRAEFIFEPIQ
jgi:Holliday junction resolvase RusA-like endonuclease